MEFEQRVEFTGIDDSKFHVGTAQTVFYGTFVGYSAAIVNLMLGLDTDVVTVIAHGTVVTTFVANALGIDPIPIWESLGLHDLVEIEWPDPPGIFSRRNIY